MLRQLLSNGSVGRDVLKQEGHYSSGNPTAFLMAQPQSGATDVIFTSVPPSIPYKQDADVKNEISYSPAYSVKSCANEDVKNEQKSLAVLSNMPPNNCYVQQSQAAPIMMRYPGNDLNGTTELFSSTFAMLSADGVVPEANWINQSGEQKVVPVMYAFNGSQVEGQPNGFNPPYVQQPVQVNTQNFNETSRFGQEYMVCDANVSVPQSQANQQIYYYQTQPTVSDVSQTPATMVCSDDINGYGVKSERPTNASFSQGFQDIAQISISSVANSGRNTPSVENENEADERVMCMACRGVYPSRRSLTGHIGRNEKCREIIGRNYLDQLGGCADKVSISGSPGGVVNPAETISPICPYCDRFISHYKGNIRRHINQCLKSDRSKSKKLSERKQEGTNAVQYSENGFTPNGYSSGNDSSYDGYQPHILTTGSGDFQWDNYSFGSSGINLSQPSPQSQHSKDGKNNDDPYLCSICDFVTVYKGNMKRHLSTCHSITEEDLGEGGLDTLRASKRSGDHQSRIGKVSRGRRPKSAQLQEECRKKAKLDLLKCSSPVVSDNASLRADSKSPVSCGGNIVEGPCGDSNSTSNSSVQEHFRSHGNLIESNPHSHETSNDLPTIVQSQPNDTNIYIPQQQLQQFNGFTDTDALRTNTVLSDNYNLIDGQNQIICSSTSSSNIDEIINAVASNQLGNINKKSARQSKTPRSGSRRSALPKTVRNMEEVRDYWEAERLSSGCSTIPSAFFSRSRNS